MDTKTILQKIDLRVLAEQAGAQFHGNSSRCPLHHGDNRTAFHVYQGQDGVWRWHCFTNCQEGHNGGSVIDFYMLWRGVDFKAAITDLAAMAGISADDHQHAQPSAAPVEPSLIDPAANPPSETWQKRASEFASYAHDQLWANNRVMAGLMVERGLIEDTIAAFNLGYNPRDIHDQAARWGLEGNAVWLPRGIVIPHCNGESSPWFVNVRRPVGTPKYAGPRGGVRGMFHGPLAGHPVMVLAEGEFDTMLAHQSAADLCDVGTLGGARHRLDMRDAAILMRYAAIICCFDIDQAGMTGAAYIRQAIGSRVTMAVCPEKDLTDYWRAKGDVRKFMARFVADALDDPLQALDMNEQPDLFCAWLNDYNRALEAL